MILSASRRTDIPCHYPRWFINRIRAGYALVRNPLNHAQLFKIPLASDIIDCIVFWTKEPEPLLPYLEELDQRGYKYYFQFTLTPYNRSLEPNLRPKVDIENTFVRLSQRIGKERIIWRYDPIILNDDITIQYHQTHFERLCQKLSPYTNRVVISFVDLYKKLKTQGLRPITPAEIAALSAFIASCAKSCGLRPLACCEGQDLTPFGIEKSACIDKALMEEICGSRLNIPKDKNQRQGCGCCQSVDIGAYNSCQTGCIYCYANHPGKPKTINHDPDSELLMGHVQSGERIIEKSLKSNLVYQSSFFDNI